MSTAKMIYHAKEDPVYRSVYVDVEAWKEKALPNGEMCRYYYVHGGFREKDICFSYCLPEKEKFTGRFFQYLSPFPGPQEEMASLEREGADDRVGFALEYGAYYVESNMGSKFQFGGAADPTLCWKASAMCAEYAREYAMGFYSCGRPYGYVYGGSGGGYKSMACIENTNAWDGAAPYVIGSPVSLPNSIVLHVQGQRVLRHVFGRIVDALDAGGSGDMYEGLNAGEAAMLKEITRMGFPPEAWFLEAAGMTDPGSLPVLIPGMKEKDPGYFKEFWEVSGYEGADPGSTACRDRLQFSGVVKGVHLPHQEMKADAIDGRNSVDDAWKKQLADGNGAWIELEEVPRGDDLYLEGVTIHITSGEAAGKKLLLSGIHGNCLVIGAAFGYTDIADALSAILPGDQVFLDNSDYIAVQYYYRHQVPEDLSFHAFDQFRNEDGTPAIPQRDTVIGYGFTGTGTIQDGNIQGKVIMNQSLMDESTWPWCAHWYRGRVKESQGNEADYRLYYNENCLHGDVSWLQSNRVINYVGALYQSLLDLSDWVERGIEPRQTSLYTYDDGQIILDADVRQRGGLQQKVTLTANGAVCAHVKAGETVTLEALSQMPTGAGLTTAFDFATEEKTAFPCADAFPYPAEVMDMGEIDGIYTARAVITCNYKTPGTYFASVRVKMNRNGKSGEPCTQVLNLTRARIIVKA